MVSPRTEEINERGSGKVAVSKGKIAKEEVMYILKQMGGNSGKVIQVHGECLTGGVGAVSKSLGKDNCWDC